MINSDLDSLNNEKAGLLIELGQLYYFMMRGGDRAQAGKRAGNIKLRILSIDLKINELLGNKDDSEEMRECAQCGAPIFNARFCPHCGFDNHISYRKDAVMCRGCKRLITDNSRFCTVCGFKLER